MDVVSLGLANNLTRKVTPHKLRSVARNTHLLVRTAAPNILSDGTSTGITTRLLHTVDTACSGIRLAFTNWYNNAGIDASGPNPITVKSYIKIGDGTFIPVPFGGAASVVIPPGATVLSDPLGIHFAKADFFFSQTYVSVFSGEVYPLGGITDSVQTEGVGAGDLTTSTVTASATRGFGPTMIVGTPVKNLTSPSLVLIGDSRVVGYGDTRGTADARGWASRALDGNLSYLNIGVSGSTTQTALLGNLRRRMDLVDLCQFDAAVVVYGVNDLLGGKTAAQIEGYLATLYGYLVTRNLPIYGATIAPVTTTTDNWQTTANQTTDASNAQRILLNTWMRTTPSPLAGYFELADAVESARDSGKWKVTGASFGYTADGTHESSGGYIAEAAVVTPSTFGAVLVT